MPRRDSHPAHSWGTRRPPPGRDPGGRSPRDHAHRSACHERCTDSAEGVFFRVSAVGRARLGPQAWSEHQIKKMSAPDQKRVNYFYWYEEGIHTPLGPSNDLAEQPLVVASQLADAVGVDYH